ncbi:secretin and TonB N-terminal domain-containing protein [Candidatus Desantisbacteria bacterium]|nr:secretin and TonB N-terminal domain-containing protein [Candidatus Desantisbacteria bacterium]
MLQKQFILILLICFAALTRVLSQTVAAENLVNIDFKGTDIKDVLRALGAQQGVNIVTDESVKGQVTIHLTNVPFEAGLNAILGAHHLTYEKEGNIYRVISMKIEKSYFLNVERGSTSGDGLLSMDAKQVDINEILRDISLQSKINVVTDKSVHGNVSLYLNKIPVEEGLQTILSTSGFKYKKENNIYIVGETGGERIKNVEIRSGLLSLDIDGADILKVLREISLQGGINIVADKSVSGLVSSHLANTPVELGLRALLEANGFTCEKISGIFYVGVSRGKKTFSIMVDEGSPPAEGATLTDKLFTVDVADAELGEVIRALALQGEKDIVTCDYVRGQINAHISKAPFEKVLALILEGTNYTFSKVNNIYVIGEGVSLRPGALTFVATEVIKINWVEANEVLTILPPVFPRDNIRLLKDQNAIVVIGTRQLIDKVSEFVKQIDKPSPQIMIEVLVVEFKKTIGNSLGIKEIGVKENEHMDVSLFPGAVEPLVLTYDVANVVKDKFFTRLEALIMEKKATVRANPRIATLNGHEASISVLTKDRYREFAKSVEADKMLPVSGQQTVESGIKLRIKPWVSASNEINVDISPEISNATGMLSADSLPQTSERKVQTTIRVKDGETIIIGGLIQTQNSFMEKRVPFVSRIPLIGKVFKWKSDEQQQSELVVYITPHLLPLLNEK